MTDCHCNRHLKIDNNIILRASYISLYLLCLQFETYIFYIKILIDLFVNFSFFISTAILKLVTAEGF